MDASCVVAATVFLPFGTYVLVKPDRFRRMDIRDLGRRRHILPMSDAQRLKRLALANSRRYLWHVRAIGLFFLVLGLLGLRCLFAGSL